MLLEDLVRSLFKKQSDILTPDISKYFANINLDPNKHNVDFRQAANLDDIVKSNGYLRLIVEHYIHNLAPRSLTGECIKIETDIQVNKDLINKLYNLLNDKIYQIVYNLVLYGSVGLLIFNEKKLKNLLDNKLQDIKFENAVDDDDQIDPEYLRLIIVNKHRYKTIKLLNLYPVGYFVNGNIIDNLSEPPTMTKQEFKSDKDQPNKLIKINLKDLQYYLSKYKISLTDEEIKEIISDFDLDKQIVFIPATRFVTIDFSPPYDNGLILNLDWHIRLLNLVRLVTANNIVKTMDILLVNVDVTETTRAAFMPILQEALRQLRERLYAIEGQSGSMVSLPNILSPLQAIFVPVNNGKPAAEFNILNLPFNGDIVNIVDRLKDDLASDSGIPTPLLTGESIEGTLLSQINMLFLQKILTLQESIENQLTSLLLNIVFTIDKDLYNLLYDNVKVKLLKPAHMILQQLFDILSSFTSISTTITDKKSFEPIKKILQDIYGEDFMDKLQSNDLDLTIEVKKVLEKVIGGGETNQQQEESEESFTM